MTTAADLPKLYKCENVECMSMGIVTSSTRCGCGHTNRRWSIPCDKCERPIILFGQKQPIRVTDDGFPIHAGCLPRSERASAKAAAKTYDKKVRENRDKRAAQVRKQLKGG